jgi:DNA-binding GntR family transcriptional regulator
MSTGIAPIPALPEGAPEPPLSAQVREILRERIIRGEYVQGARLPEAKLAAELHVSRIPLRAAIPQLEVDGFVRTLPRRSAVVFEWGERAVNDLFDVRLAIEPMAAAHAARQVARGASVDGVKAAIASSHAAIDRGDPYEIARASTLIHERVVELSGNELLASLMRAVSGRITWLFYMTSQRDQNLACQQHHDLSDTIASGNEELARAVAFAHIEAGRAPSLEAISRLTH